MAVIRVGEYTGEVRDCGPPGEVEISIHVHGNPLPLAVIGAKNWEAALPTMQDWVADWDHLIHLNTQSDDYIFEVLETLRQRYPPPFPTFRRDEAAR